MRKFIPKCSLLKVVDDRLSELAKEYANINGKASESRYIRLGTLIHRKTCQKLRETFMWEDHGFIDFDPVVFYSANTLSQIESTRLQSISHDYRNMILHMKENGFVCVSEKYCHEKDSIRFCKGYTIHPKLICSAINTNNSIELVERDVPKSEIDELIELAEEAKKTKWVEYNGIRMRFDIDEALKNVSDDFTKCQKDKYCITVSKMKTALWAWIDRSRNHQDHIVDFRNFHFLTSMPKAALIHIYDERGRQFHELVDLPCGNILTTAMSFYKEHEICREEYKGIINGIFKTDGVKSIYDQFKDSTSSQFSRNFIKKCFQIVINCSDRQLLRHEKKAELISKYPGNIHIQKSKCVSDICKWMNEKYPQFENRLRNFELVQSTNHPNRMVKGTYYAFTFIEKSIIEELQKGFKENTIRIHDAIWGFQNDSSGIEGIRRVIEDFEGDSGYSGIKDVLPIISSNKVSKFRTAGRRCGKLMSPSARKRPMAMIL